jgi:aminoglycoside phosphotransferase (APT) family kinase protein
MRMHADQVDVTVADARRILPPELTGRPVRPVASGGTVNRAYVRRRLGLDDDTWRRGAAWALAQALVALPYYRHTNPHMTASARYAIRAVLGR